MADGEEDVQQIEAKRLPFAHGERPADDLPPAKIDHNRLAQASEQENLEDSLRLAALMRTLNFLSKPTIARVNGSAYGGGVGLVACCDLAIGVETAKFSLSEVKLGLVPAVISPYVIAAIGPRHARRLFTGAEVIEAPEAREIGLLHQVVPAAELDATVERALDSRPKEVRHV